MLNAYIILSVLFIFTKPIISIANFWVRKMHAALLGFYGVLNARALHVLSYVTDLGSNDHSFSLRELLRPGQLGPFQKKKNLFYYL